jgi:calcineurin-like phosphoesterase family protein
MEEGEEIIVQRHNAVVKPNDRVYFLGDVAMPKSGLATLARMNGRKVLIKGNHDVHKLSQYVQYFDDIRGSHQLSGILMTHIPVHEDSLARWGFNVHGHLHTNRVRTWDGSIDERYLCVCVEQINYTPISLEEVKSKKPI